MRPIHIKPTRPACRPSAVQCFCLPTSRLDSLASPKRLLCGHFLCLFIEALFDFRFPYCFRFRLPCDLSVCLGRGVVMWGERGARICLYVCLCVRERVLSRVMFHLWMCCFPLCVFNPTVQVRSRKSSAPSPFLLCTAFYPPASPSWRATVLLREDQSPLCIN